MKYCLIIPDGAADYALARLEGKTPLEAARTPNMDRAAREGLLGRTQNVPPRMNPGSAEAIMSVLGYDPRHYFTGRAPLEAADLGIEMGPQDWAVRCNLITTADGVLADFTAGHISNEEAGALIQSLNQILGTAEVAFHPGVSYRHIMMYLGAEPLAAETVPPHDVVGEPLAANFPNGQGAELLVDLMERSRGVLEPHDVNQVRVDLGKNPANMIWLWGQGKRPAFESFQSRYGLDGAAISAVNLVRGMALLIGWDVIKVPGATGYLDTDYAAKGRYAVDALTTHDIVVVHVEAPDEASHEKDLKAKIRAIEQIDRQIVGPVMAQCEGGEGGEGLRLLIEPDHVTSIEDGRHKRGWVPFVMWGSGVRAASGHSYSEANAEATEVDVPEGHHLMAEFLGGSAG